jgi:hypothetical protein
MARRTDPEKLFLEQYMQPLVGCTITAVRVKVEDGQCWPVIVAQSIRRRPGQPLEVFELEISRDPEGNGPGWIFGLPHPGEKSKTEG